MFSRLEDWLAAVVAYLDNGFLAFENFMLLLLLAILVFSFPSSVYFSIVVLLLLVLNMLVVGSYC